MLPTYEQTSGWGYAPKVPRQISVRRQFSSPLVQSFVESFETDATADGWYSPAEPRPATDLIVLVVMIAICNGLGLLVGMTFDPTFYASLAAPTWAPEGWLIAPIWTLLYTMMAVAAWMVWRMPDTPERNIAMGWFSGQLILNFAWTPIFFGAHAVGAALMISAILFASVAAMIAAFWNVRRLAAVMMVPYLGCVGFATALNAAVWALNQ